MIRIRRATADDAPAVAEVFLRSFRAAYPSLPAVHTDDQVRTWIARSVVAESDCWVAVEARRVVGMMALTPGWLDHLYVAPGYVGRGIGRRLLSLAMERAPGRLELWTFQANVRARRFYERNGFVEAERTDGRGNEEHEPDVRYVWVADSGRPASGRER